jgi:hypothetical protein
LRKDKGSGVYYNREEYFKAYNDAIILMGKHKRYYLANKEAILRKTAQWRKDNPEKVYLYHVKMKFGLSVEEYTKLLASQKERCAICKGKDKRKLCVDHCHKTNKVRQLLCDRCNRLLGIANDNKGLLKLVIKYLCKHN